MSILAMAGFVHILAASSSGTSGTDLLAFFAVPIGIALIAAIWAIARASMRLGQYMARSEEAQESIAKSNTEINEKLHTFIEKTNEHLAAHDQDLAVLHFAVDSNGFHQSSHAGRKHQRKTHPETSESEGASS